MRENRGVENWFRALSFFPITLGVFFSTDPVRVSYLTVNASPDLRQFAVPQRDEPSRLESHAYLSSARSTPNCIRRSLQESRRFAGRKKVILLVHAQSPCVLLLLTQYTKASFLQEGDLPQQPRPLIQQPQHIHRQRLSGPFCGPIVHPGYVVSRRPVHAGERGTGERRTHGREACLRPPHD